jgi:hypothetical protein
MMVVTKVIYNWTVLFIIIGIFVALYRCVKLCFWHLLRTRAVSSCVIVPFTVYGQLTIHPVWWVLTAVWRRS